MQNHAFWYIFSSENGQLLTGANPEGTAKGEGWVLRKGTPKASPSEAPKPKTLKASRGWEMGKGFPLSQPTTEYGAS